MIVQQENAYLTPAYHQSLLKKNVHEQGFKSSLYSRLADSCSRTAFGYKTNQQSFSRLDSRCFTPAQEVLPNSLVVCPCKRNASYSGAPLR